MREIEVKNKREMTCIKIPTDLFTKYGYKEGKLLSMVYIYLLLGRNNFFNQPFIFKDFVKWYSPSGNAKSRSYLSKTKNEIIKIFEEMKNDNLIKILDTHPSYYEIELEEEFYTFGATHAFKTFVTLYIDELEKIMNGEYTKKENGFTRNMMLNVFLYLKSMIGLKDKNHSCYHNYISSLATEMSIDKNALSKIIDELKELKLIYSIKTDVKWVKEREGFYYDKTIFTKYYNRFNKKVDYCYKLFQTDNENEYITWCIDNYEEID